MNKLRVFLTLTGYQITWLACAFGENKFAQPFGGIYFGIIFLFLYLYFCKNKIRFLKIAFLISMPGYLFDSLMVYFSIYEFNTSFVIGTLPIWMPILWLSFSTLFDEILVFFQKFKLIGIFLGGLLGPLTYYLGETINVLSINNIILFFILMVIYWCLLMIFYLNYILIRN
tara:strand:+ start:363 stop:875 length:513 start_codon:yes stop_codon:yes gene_type:complete